VLLRGWLHLGASEAVIRGLSVLPAAATVPLVYALGKHLFDRYTGAGASLLLAIHAAHVSYSQEARAYTLAVLLCSLSMMLFVRLLEAPSSGTVVLYAAVTAAAMYTHFFAALIVPAQLVSLLALPRSRVPWRWLLAGTALTTLLAAPIAMWVRTHDAGQLSWISHTNWGSVRQLFAFLLGSGIRIPIFVALWYVALQHFLRLRRKGDSGWPYALVASWLLTPILLVLVASLHRPVLAARFLLICLPAVVLLGVEGSRLLRPRWLRWGSLALLAGLLLASLHTYYGGTKDDWRAQPVSC
jgi:uncharacterized membrane protein